jgi:hypothetical protein
MKKSDPTLSQTIYLNHRIKKGPPRAYLMIMRGDGVLVSKFIARGNQHHVGLRWVGSSHGNNESAGPDVQCYHSGGRQASHVV